MGTNGGHGRHNPRFTPEDRRAILQAHDDGESAASIARRYGCHPSAVRYHLLCTLRVIPVRDRAVMGHTTRCSRCGIDTTRATGPVLCRDCTDLERDLPAPHPGVHHPDVTTARR